MSSKQISFFAVPDDLKQFESFFKQKETGIIKLPVYDPANLLSKESISIRENEKEWTKAYLTKESFLENIVIKRIEEQNYYLVDEQRSNVMEFYRPLPDPYNNSMECCRFYYITSYLDPTGKKKDKDPAFIDWADNLVKQFKKEFLIKEKADKSNYYTKGILNMLEDGLIEQHVPLPAHFKIKAS